MAINDTLPLSWEGEDYELIVTMKIVDKIEEHVNLMKMVGMMSQDIPDIRFSQAAKVISILLTAAGCPVSQEDVWNGMFGDGELTTEDAVIIMWKIIPCIFPEPKKKPTAGKRLKSSTRTRGKRSTK